MNIFSVILRVLTILLIGGSITLWHMTGTNIKKKIGGDKDMDYITTLLGGPGKDGELGTDDDEISIFEENTNLAYEVLGSDEDWKAYEEEKKLFNETIAQKDPTTVLSIDTLRTKAIEKLVGEGVNPDEDEENINSKKHAENPEFHPGASNPHPLAPELYGVDMPNGVPEILEMLPDEINKIANQADTIDALFENQTVSNRATSANSALKGLMEKKGYEVSKELKVKNREETSTKSDNAEDRLKAAFAKFFWERETLFGEINALRQQVADKDQKIIALQIRRVASIAQEDISEGDQGVDQQFNGEVKHLLVEWQKSYKKGETEKTALQVELGREKEKLAETKANLQATELAKQELDDEWKTKMKDTRENYEGQLQEKERDKINFGQDEYLRGWTEATKEFKGEIAGTEEKTRPNYFDEENPTVPVGDGEDAAPAEGEAPPQQPVVPNNLTPGQNNPLGEGLEEPKFDGIMTNVLRILPRDGLIILYIGSENGLSNGNLFTLVKEGKQAARIKITDTKPKYCVANILPEFGDPRNLRAGDQVKVVR